VSVLSRRKLLKIRYSPFAGSADSRVYLSRIVHGDSKANPRIVVSGGIFSYQRRKDHLTNLTNSDVKTIRTASRSASSSASWRARKIKSIFLRGCSSTRASPEYHANIKSDKCFNPSGKLAGWSGMGREVPSPEHVPMSVRS